MNEYDDIESKFEAEMFKGFPSDKKHFELQKDTKGYYLIIETYLAFKAFESGYKCAMESKK